MNTSSEHIVCSFSASALKAPSIDDDYNITSWMTLKPTPVLHILKSKEPYFENSEKKCKTCEIDGIFMLNLD